MQCDVERCAARYSSFHAADCTYQPYGGGSRSICEISSRSADAAPQTPAATAPTPIATVKPVAAKGEAVVKSAAPSPSPAGLQCNVSLCAATHKTFNPADCTYQPYGGGPRQVCENSSRRSAEASPPMPRAATPPKAKDTQGAETVDEVDTTEEVEKSPIPARAGTQCNAALCAGRYKSFSAADCTYEPYGGGPRRICE